MFYNRFSIILVPTVPTLVPLPMQYHPRVLFYRLMCVVVLLFIMNMPVVADSKNLLGVGESENKIYQFATYLYKSQEYYRSISEYKRLLYLFPESHFAEKAKLQIGRAYMAGGDVASAIQYWEEQLQKLEDNQRATSDVKVLLGISLLDFERGKSYRLRVNHIEKAFRELEKIPIKHPFKREVFDFTEEWKQRESPSYKTPWLAGTMSALLPGTGSFYSGRYLEGTYAFFLTTLFYAATKDAFKHDKEELGAIFGFFTLTFYGGNIYAAMNSVHKTNDKMDSDTLLGLRKKHGIWFIPETDHRSGRF